jgi:branched-subunit amino acid aminotransferase/4-amino-4-deoxychorismate lyase
MAEFRLIDSSIFQYQILDLILSRGFQYGDGFFESMLYGDGQVRLAGFHQERMNEALELLGLYSPFHQRLTDYLTNEIPTLLNKESCRLKLMIWRKGQGKYSPTGSEADFALIASPYVEQHAPISTIRVSNSCFLEHHPTSSFKTMSSLIYVMAGKEAVEQGNELILLSNKDGFLAEGLNSNLFLFRKGQLYTPPLTSGCINGVVRRWMLSNNDPMLNDLWFKADDLKPEDQLFLANAFGVRVIHQLEQIKLNVQEDFAEHLREKIYRS